MSSLNRMRDEESVVIGLIENEIQAGLIASLLEEHSIPFAIETMHSSPFDGIFEMQSSYGRLRVLTGDEERARLIFDDLTSSTEQGDNE